MTDLLSRIEPVLRRADAGRPPGWITGALAGAVAGCAGVLACGGLAVLAWLAGTGGTVADALRAGGVGWLLALGSGLDVPGAHVGVVPWGLTAVVLSAAWWGGRWAWSVSGGGPRSIAEIGSAAGAAYAVVATVVALLVSTPTLTVSMPRLVPTAFVLSGSVAAAGAARAGGIDRVWQARLPIDVRSAGHGAIRGLGALGAVASLVLAASLLGHLGQLRQLLSTLHLGVPGGLLLLLGCLLVAPNAVLLTISVLLGPGLVLGVGTSVSLTSVQLGAVPAVPWFAALPQTAPPPALVAVLLALPLCCGVAAGVWAMRAHPVDGYARACLRGALAGALAGVCAGIAMAASGGSLGPGRMAAFGPHLWAVLAAPALLALGGVAGGAATRLAARL